MSSYFERVGKLEYLKCYVLVEKVFFRWVIKVIFVEVYFVISIIIIFCLVCDIIVGVGFFIRIGWIDLRFVFVGFIVVFIVEIVILWI